MTNNRHDFPRVRLGYNALTGEKEFIVIPPLCTGFSFNLKPWQHKALRKAYMISNHLNQERKEHVGTP